MRKIPKDKKQHFIVGLLIALVSEILGFPMYIGFLVVIAAIGKEVYDKQFPKKHTRDIIDAIFTIAGGMVMESILLLLDV